MNKCICGMLDRHTYTYEILFKLTSVGLTQARTNNTDTVLSIVAWLSHFVCSVSMQRLISVGMESLEVPPVNLLRHLPTKCNMKHYLLVPRHSLPANVRLRSYVSVVFQTQSAFLMTRLYINEQCFQVSWSTVVLHM